MVVSAFPIVTGLGGVFVTPRTESCSSQRWDFLATTQGVVVSEGVGPRIRNMQSTIASPEVEGPFRVIWKC